jgi:hypothetical protein
MHAIFLGRAVKSLEPMPQGGNRRLAVRGGVPEGLDSNEAARGLAAPDHLEAGFIYFFLVENPASFYFG